MNPDTRELVIAAVREAYTASGTLLAVVDETDEGAQIALELADGCDALLRLAFNGASDDELSAALEQLSARFDAAHEVVDMIAAELDE